MNQRERPTRAMVQEGELCSSCLYDANVENVLGGLGGCKYFDLESFPTHLHDLITAYLEGEMSGVEATYIAMHRRKGDL